MNKALSLFVVLLIVACTAQKENKDLVNKILTNNEFKQVKDKAIK